MRLAQGQRRRHGVDRRVPARKRVPLVHLDGRGRRGVDEGGPCRGDSPAPPEEAAAARVLCGGPLREPADVRLAAAAQDHAHRVADDGNGAVDDRLRQLLEGEFGGELCEEFDFVHGVTGLCWMAIGE